jgi:hypothetical protein
MIVLQSPALQIFNPAQSVSGANVAAQGFPPIPAIQAHHVVLTHRLAQRDSGGQHFFDRSLSSKLTKASVHGGDEVGKLTSPPKVAPDDFRQRSESTLWASMAFSAGIFRRINIRMRRAFEKI